MAHKCAWKFDFKWQCTHGETFVFFPPFLSPTIAEMWAVDANMHYKYVKCECAWVCVECKWVVPIQISFRQYANGSIINAFSWIEIVFLIINFNLNWNAHTHTHASINVSYIFVCEHSQEKAKLKKNHTYIHTYILPYVKWV